MLVNFGLSNRPKATREAQVAPPPLPRGRWEVASPNPPDRGGNHDLPAANPSGTNDGSSADTSASSEFPEALRAEDC